MTDGAGDIAQRPISAPLKGPVWVALKPSFISKVIVGFVARGGDLIAQEFALGGQSICLKKQERGLSAETWARRKFRRRSEIEPVKLPCLLVTV